ncbi:nephrin-like [Varroa jacobsoni]|uniref:nephrin-like n=1 Tax=Varroa jacobsoni TaxID=62625 RepID=UPI000BF7E8DD|nr:nephrin-like [Varroa jacobsoni]
MCVSYYRSKRFFQASLYTLSILQINPSVYFAVPPSEVRIRDQKGKTLTGFIGPFDEGASLVVTCEAIDAKPRARVSWYSDGKLIHDSDVLVPNHPRRLVTNELTIKRLDRSHLHATFVCHAQNEDKSERKVSRENNYLSATIPTTLRTANITIDMNLPPLEIRINRIRQPLSTKRRTEATCTSVGGRPHPQLTWWINNKKLKVLRESGVFGNNFTTNTVSFLPTVDDDRKYLSCRAEGNPLLPETPFEDSFLLNVQYPPQLNLVLGKHMLNATSVREGTDVYFDCQVRANPAVTEVFWKFKGLVLAAHARQGIIMTNQSLVLQQIHRESAGQYQCVAANSEGEIESNELELRVHFAPVCRSRQNLVYGVAVDEDADIPCNVDADPPPTKYTWTLNTTNVADFDEKAFSFNHTRSIVTYRPRFAKSFGTLFCWATNEVGSQVQPCAYRLIPASPPSSVEHCMARNQTDDIVLIKCKPGDAGGLRQTFHLEIFNVAVEHLELNLTRTDTPVFQVPNLIPSTKYVFVLYASNAKGRSSPIRLTVTTPASSKKHSSEGTGLFSSLLKLELVLLLAVLAIVVLLILSVTVILQRRRTIKDHHQGMHNHPSSANLNDKNSGSCRSLKAPVADDLQLTQMKGNHNNSRDPPQQPCKQHLLSSKSGSIVSMTLPDNSKERHRIDNGTFKAVLVQPHLLNGDPSVSCHRGLVLRTPTLQNPRHPLDQFEKVDFSLSCERKLLSPLTRQKQSESWASSRNCSHRSSRDCSCIRDTYLGRPSSRQGLAPLVRLDSDEGGKGREDDDTGPEETRTPLLKSVSST